MAAHLDDAAALEDDDRVGPPHGRQPVRDHERGAIEEQRRQRVLDQPLRFGVERRRGLVQDQDRRVLEQRAGDRQALALPARQPLPALADRRPVAVRKRRDEVVGMSGARGGLDLGGARPAARQRRCWRRSCRRRARSPASPCRSGARSDASVTSRTSCPSMRSARRSRRRSGAAGSRGWSCRRRSARRSRPSVRPNGEADPAEGVSPLPVLVAERDVREDDVAAERRQWVGARRARCTSLWVSSSSKIRSDAATACWRFALTRLSFLIGPYISSSAATKSVNSPAVSRPLAISRVPYQSAPAIANAAQQLHQRRQDRQDARHLHVRAIERAGRARRTSPPRAPRHRTP